jgi:two-component system, NtrC family, sensor histidine kinase KinB
LLILDVTMLRLRLLLNLVPFLAILLAIGVCAVVLFGRLAREVDTLVTMNYQTVMATQDMALSLARMQAAVQLGIDADRDDAGQFFRRHVALFQQHLERQRQNVRSSHESARTDELDRLFRILRGTGAEILSEEKRAGRIRAYDESFYPTTLAIQQQLDELRRSAHVAILVTGESADRMVRQVTLLMGVAILAGLLLSGGSAYRLARSILAPIQSLTRATEELARGGSAPAVVVRSRDELATLAASFNQMAAQLHEYRKSTSAELLRLHHTMEATLASFPDPVFVLGPDGNIQLRNPSAETLTRKLGLADHALPPPLQALVDESRASGSAHVPNDFKEVITLRLDSQERFYLPRIVVMREQDGVVLGVAAVLYDLTRFRLLDAMKTNLVATVSHELKTPLTGVRMALHLLLEQSIGTLTPRQLEMVTTASDDTERLLRILNDLLDLARLDEGTSALRREPMPASALIETVASELAESVRAAGLRLTFEVEADAPCVEVDARRIHHVFANLISNAIKHSPAGGEIRLACRHAAPGDVEFSVQDNGPGVPPEFQNRVFERFFRVPGQVSDGAGLGLSVAREIVVAHGGYIGVRSAPGSGSTFHFTLPALPHPVES